MKTNLAYIATAASAAVAKEIDNPQLPAVQERQLQESGMRVIAGFTAYDEAAVSEARDKSLADRRQLLEVFRRDRESAESKLTARGIVPLAVLPKAAWERICTSSGLYRLDSDEFGRVGIDTGALREFDKRATNKLSLLQLIGNCVIIVAAIAGAITTFRDPQGFGYFMGLVVAAAIVLLVFNSNVYAKKTFFDEFDNRQVTITSRLHQRAVRRHIRRFGMLPHTDVLKAFFPGGVSSSFSKLRAKVVLPPVPNNVADILIRAQGLPLKTALVGEALAFAETPAHILNRGLDSKIKEDIVNWERALRERPDPIVYVEEGSAVAIIAQFGDFPIEKEAVDLALFSEHLI